MLLCLSVLMMTDVDGRLWRTPLVIDSSVSQSVSSELLSPPMSKDCKHCLAVVAIDAVQLAIIGPASETNTGTHNTTVIIFLDWSVFCNLAICMS